MNYWYKHNPAMTLLLNSFINVASKSILKNKKSCYQYKYDLPTYFHSVLENPNASKYSLSYAICIDHIITVILNNIKDIRINNKEHQLYWDTFVNEHLNNNHIAIDIYNYLNCNYLYRALIFPVALLKFIYDILNDWIISLENDKFGYDGITQFPTNLPIKDILQFYKINYHPKKYVYSKKHMI